MTSFQMAFKRQSELYGIYKEPNQKADEILTKAAENGNHISWTMGTKGPYLEYITYVLNDGTCVTKVQLASLSWTSEINEIGPIW